MKRLRKPTAPDPPWGHHGTTYKDVFKRWQNLSADKLANAIFDNVKGNTTRLIVPPTLSQSVWGNIIRTLGFPNTKLDRLWAASAFENNTNVQVIIWFDVKILLKFPSISAFNIIS